MSPRRKAIGRRMHSTTGRGLAVETLEQGGEYPDDMPQARWLTDAQAAAVSTRPFAWRAWVYSCARADDNGLKNIPGRPNLDPAGDDILILLDPDLRPGLLPGLFLTKPWRMDGDHLLDMIARIRPDRPHAWFAARMDAFQGIEGVIQHSADFGGRHDAFGDQGGEQAIYDEGGSQRRSFNAIAVFHCDASFLRFSQPEFEIVLAAKWGADQSHSSALFSMLTER